MRPFPVDQPATLATDHHPSTRTGTRSGSVREKAGEVERKSLWSKIVGLFAGRPGVVQDGGNPRAETTTMDGSPTFSKLRVGVASTVGTVRDHNEDNFFLPGQSNQPQRGGDGDHKVGFDYNIDPDKPYPFIVADGMGGQLAGEKASQMAVDLIPTELYRRIGSNETGDAVIQRTIRDSIAAANQEILGLSHIQTEFSNMGTTVVLILFRNNQAFIAGIGDSRTYRIRDGQIEQLTKDHSLADALVEAGTISKEELPNHKFKHILYLYLGSKDARSGPEEVRVAEVLPRDRFLLASDGLTGVVSDEVVAQVISEGDDPTETAARLVDLAIENQSKDNVTCMVIHAQ
jgi:serine/threonine protein phosphatase PrpC